LDKEEEEK